MRLGEHAEATIAAALDAGITLFDTARAYPGNEALLASALPKKRDSPHFLVVTKGGMARPGDAWVPDGRAKAIRADCEASLAALDGLPIDTYLLHAPDPRTPWATSVRALAKLADEGLVRQIGVCNVNRRQLDEALALAPIAAVQVAISPFDEHALRGGIVERCAGAGVTVLAHSPLGGPKRAPRLAHDERVAAIAAAHDATPAEVALARLLALGVIPLVGATRPETARSAARAVQLELSDNERAWGARKGNVPLLAGRDVVVVMGIPGAGKTRVAAALAAEGYERLNRDARGGTLRDIAGALDERLAGGVQRLVLDNTYLSRASRSYVL